MAEMSPIQKDLFEKMPPKTWISANELDCRVSTLRAMAKKGVVDTRSKTSCLGDAGDALLFKRRR